MLRSTKSRAIPSAIGGPAGGPATETLEGFNPLSKSMGFRMFIDGMEGKEGRRIVVPLSSDAGIDEGWLEEAGVGATAAPSVVGTPPPPIKSMGLKYNEGNDDGSL